MTIQGAFRRMIFGRKGVDEGPPPTASDLHPTIIAELRRLDLYSPGLGGKAITYVATGANADVIAKIDTCQKATPVHLAPYHKDTNGLHGTAAETARAIVTGEIRPGPEIGRLLQVQTATHYFTVSHWQNIPPEKHLLAALFALLNRGVSATQVSYKTPWETLIPLSQVFDHVKLLGGNMVDLFGYILSRDETHYLQAESWFGGTASGEFAVAYPRAFAEALRATAPKRRQAVKLAEHYGATSAEEISSLLVEMLTKPFGKDDREIAISALARLDAAQLLALLQRDLAGGDIDTRYGLVQAAAQNGSAELLALLAERGKSERAAKVKAAIDAALESKGSPADAPEAAQGEPGFAAIDGSFVALPTKKEIASDEPRPVSDEDRTEYRRIAQTIVDDLRQQQGSSSTTRLRIAQEDIDPSFELLTRGTALPEGINFGLAYSLRRRDDGRAWFNRMLDGQPLGVALSVALGNVSGAVASVINNRGYVEPNARIVVDKLTAWLENGDLELRHMANAQQLRTLLTRTGYSYDRRNELATLQELPSDAVWPWIAENLSVIDEALGLQPSSTPIELDRALTALALLPRVPQRYFARLFEIAVTEKRPLRRQAMALLSGAKDLVTRIETLLDDARQQVRINAATWLADLRSEASEGPLRKRLKKEKSDPVRAALIEALQRLGADLGDVIGPASLIAEAEAAAAKAAPALPDWLPASGLPAARFRDGKTVPEGVLRHWLSLAIRLKDPGASGQFGIYLDQLDPADARSLSNWVLESWISYDTGASSVDEATAYALANYQLDWRWQYQPRQSPELRDEIIAKMVREKTGELLNSGSDSKGMLALACRADAAWAANRVRWFLKKHGRRSNQAMALLEVLVGIDEPAALQVVIAASARLKQKSTQARATEIAERYAEDRGWSFDELADRTVPSAGFDDDGVLDLPCGEDGKLYTARLDASLAIHLFNPDGNPVKGLPAGDDDNSKDSKKTLAAAKKELTQVVELQAARLFEAMCVERDWPVADWRMAFHEHPVMRRLVERLVWQGLDADGLPLAMFRPTQEGDFTDAADNAVDIDSFAKLRLAHGALTDEATCQAWIAHLKDYEIKPFLAQFDTLRAPLSETQAEEEIILDRQGWTADSLTFRGVAEKRGYERIMRDGGGCNEYQKSFPSHGIIATIFHTGSYAVDENNRVALKELRFAKQGHRGPFLLKHVPAIMLAECWADYHAVAAKGAFEPEWEKVSPW